MDSKIVYKIVKEVSGRFFSGNPGIGMIAGALEGNLEESPYVLEYKLGSPTTPLIPDSKLFVFDTVGHARKWCNGILEKYTYHSHFLFKCEAIGVGKLHSNVALLPGDSSLFTAFWKKYKDNIYLDGMGCLTPSIGMLLADWVTPISIVDLSEEV